MTAINARPAALPCTRTFAAGEFSAATSASHAADLSRVLASYQAPPMPSHVADRIGLALAAEAAGRLAAA